MSDEDTAQAIELQQWEMNNRPRTEPIKFTPSDARYGPADCDECGAEMPKVRREYGFNLCVECKSKMERISALRR